MSITSLPQMTESTGELGQSKVDDGTYTDPTKQVKAAHWNTIRTRLIEVFTEVGLSDGSTASSLNARMLARENLGSVKDNMSASGAPGVNDDTANGYHVGSLWAWGGNGLWYCTSATNGAASWRQVLDASNTSLLLSTLTAMFNAADTTLGPTPLGGASHSITLYGGSALVLRSDNDIQVYGGGSVQLYGLAEPGSDNAAATKKYVDRPPRRDVGTGSTDTLAYTDFGSVVRYARVGTVAIALPDLSAYVTSGRAHTILLVFADAATNPTITPTGAGVKLNESTSAYNPGAAAGVLALTTFDGLRWYR